MAKAPDCFAGLHIDRTRNLPSRQLEQIFVAQWQPLVNDQPIRAAAQTRGTGGQMGQSNIWPVLCGPTDAVKRTRDLNVQLGATDDGFYQRISL